MLARLLRVISTLPRHSARRPRARSNRNLVPAAIERLESRIVLTAYTWTGMSVSGTPEDFFATDNWDPSGVPQEGDTATFNLPNQYDVAFFVPGQQITEHTTGDAFFKQGTINLDLNDDVTDYRWILESITGTRRFVVGDTSDQSATVNVEGGFVQPDVLSLGTDTGSTGTVNVQNSEIDPEDETNVGLSGTGVLKFRGGEAYALLSYTRIGVFQGSDGTVDIDGIKFADFGVIEVGNSGHGLLKIQNMKNPGTELSVNPVSGGDLIIGYETQGSATLRR